MATATESRAAFDAAQAALAATATPELLTKAYQLTHQMHACDEQAADSRRNGERGQAVAFRRIAADLRAQRDMIGAEILRRTGEA